MCLGIAVLVVAVIALRDPRGHVGARGTSTSASSVAKHSTAARTPSHPAATSADRHGDSNTRDAARTVPLIVLNDTTVQGLAARAADRFREGGWTVTHSDNYQNEILSTCAYYDPSIDGAKAAAQALQEQFPSIKRVKKRFSELPDGPIVVVLTPDYTET